MKEVRKVKVKAIKKFNDTTANGKRRKVDELLTVSDERGKKLIKDGFAVEEKEANAREDAAEKKG